MFLKLCLWTMCLSTCVLVEHVLDDPLLLWCHRGSGSLCVNSVIIYRTHCYLIFMFVADICVMHFTLVQN
jgi:hypothetical protein